MTLKAQKGDLIRIVNAQTRKGHYKNGDILEVVGRWGNGVIISVDSPYNDIYDTEYVIHRKAGEESTCDNCGKQGVHTCRGAEYHASLHEGESVVPANSDAELTQANRIRAACSELADLLVRKNHDYGDSFAQQYAKYGLMSALIRMDDKMRRLETLQCGEQSLVSESIDDSLQDLAGYAVLTLVERLKSK